MFSPKTNACRTVSNVAAIIAAVVMLSAATAARAQVLYGSLTGTVTDSSGAVVAGGNVTCASRTRQA